MASVFDELVLRMQAGQALVGLVTWEEDRVLRQLDQIATQNSRQLLRWTATTGLVGAGGSAKGTAAARAALASLTQVDRPSIAVFHDVNPDLTDPVFCRALRDSVPLLQAQQVFLVLLAPDILVPQSLEKLLEILDLPLPDAAERNALVAAWADKLGPALGSSLGHIAQASAGLTEAETIRCLSRTVAAGLTKREEVLGFLATEKQKLIRQARFVELIEPNVTFADVGGLSSLKEWLEQRRAAFTTKARDFGLPEPKGLLLLGVQGCGKSLTAKAVANLWQMPLLRLDASGLLGANEGEVRFRETVRIAEAMAPAVMWVDEIDKAFGNLGGSGAALRVFGSFITWMQEKRQPVFVIATANDVSSLPAEMLRKGRFDEIFFIDLPDIHDRAAILRIHLEHRKRNPDSFDMWGLAEATEKYSGAELEQLIIDALFRAYAQKRDVVDEDFQLGARDTVPLAVTLDKQIKELRTWARDRTRPAAQDLRRVDFFVRWGAMLQDGESRRRLDSADPQSEETS